MILKIGQVKKLSEHHWITKKINGRFRGSVVNAVNGLIEESFDLYKDAEKWANEMNAEIILIGRTPE
jgi:hypothetical protein